MALTSHRILMQTDSKFHAASLCPDQTFGLFHVIGKFIYSRKSVEPYDLAELWDDDLDMFNLYLHHNFINAYNRIEDVSLILDGFASSDILCSSQRLHEHWRREYYSIPSRTCSYICTSEAYSYNGRILMNKPTYFTIFVNREKNRKNDLYL